MAELCRSSALALASVPTISRRSMTVAEMGKTVKAKNRQTPTPMVTAAVSCQATTTATSVVMLPDSMMMAKYGANTQAAVRSGSSARPQAARKTRPERKPNWPMLESAAPREAGAGARARGRTGPEEEHGHAEVDAEDGT
jgi:hypothetical protein